MSLIERFVNPILNFRKNFWLRTWGCLDVGFKKMFILASLHARLTACGHDEEACDKLNAYMKLSRCNRTLYFPAAICDKLWRNVKPLENMANLNDRYYERLIRMTPCWLIYADESTFKQDLQNLIDYCINKPIHDQVAT